LSNTLYRSRHGHQFILSSFAPLPQRAQTAAGNRFGITRARVSQLMTILEKFPADFISVMKTTEDQSLLKRFSGKTLLKIVKRPDATDQQIYIKKLTESLN